MGLGIPCPNDVSSLQGLISWGEWAAPLWYHKVDTGPVVLGGWMSMWVCVCVCVCVCETSQCETEQRAERGMDQVPRARIWGWISPHYHWQSMVWEGSESNLNSILSSKQFLSYLFLDKENTFNLIFVFAFITSKYSAYGRYVAFHLYSRWVPNVLRKVLNIHILGLQSF